MELDYCKQTEIIKWFLVGPDNIFIYSAWIEQWTYFFIGVHNLLTSFNITEYLYILQKNKKGTSKIAIIQQFLCLKCTPFFLPQKLRTTVCTKGEKKIILTHREPRACIAERANNHILKSWKWASNITKLQNIFSAKLTDPGTQRVLSTPLSHFGVKLLALFWFVKYETLHNNQTISTGNFPQSLESVNQFNQQRHFFTRRTEIEHSEREKFIRSWNDERGREIDKMGVGISRERASWECEWKLREKGKWIPFKVSL